MHAERAESARDVAHTDWQGMRFHEENMTTKSALSPPFGTKYDGESQSQNTGSIRHSERKGVLSFKLSQSEAQTFVLEERASKGRRCCCQKHEGARLISLQVETQIQLRRRTRLSAY